MSWSLFTFIVLGSLLLIGDIASARYIRDSAITKISLPYNSASPSTRYGFGYGNNNYNGRTAYIPEPMHVIDLNLNTKEDLKVLKMQGARESRVNLADGAYPVYYTPSNVNGQFNGKMYLLKY
ncbi:hypothetical protein ACFFRR_007765 [Megaselia abdita]